MTGVVPKVGEYVLYRSDRAYDPVKVEIKRAAKVTAAMVKFDGGYPRQCSLLSVVGSFASEDLAKAVRDRIGGAAGEYARRKRIADDQRSAAMTAAITAANRQVAAIVAKAASEIATLAPQGDVQ